MKHILITGGCGFIGHHLVDLILKSTDWKVSILDGLTYASRGLDRLEDIRAFEHNRVCVFPVNLAHPVHADIISDLGTVDYAIHMAAEVHVDKSIKNPEKFVQSNIMGTFHTLQLARELQVKHFLYFSTDEIFGPAIDGKPHQDWDRYNSSNPYSATKAAGEEMTLAWANTYGLPITITHCTNVFGERQNPEAFIPSTITKILRGDKVSIHTRADGKSGSRFYIHAAEVASAVLFIINHSAARDKFNITGTEEISNLDLAYLIGDVLNKPVKIEMTHTARPGCDFRYGIDGSKLRGLGWEPKLDFENNLDRVVQWYAKSPQWLEKRTTAVFGGRK